MKINQALVAVGGSGTRLERGGISVPISKSFLDVNGRTALQHCLQSLSRAGITKLVIVGNRAEHLLHAEVVLSLASTTFERIDFFQDLGLGVHGLPWQARSLLDEQFVFECGHSVVLPEHYRRIIELKQVGQVVFSGFRPYFGNVRQPVSLKRGFVNLANRGRPANYAVAHPFVLDQEYVSSLPNEGFRIMAMIEKYSSRGNLRYVRSSMPAEFDTVDEYREVLRAHMLAKDLLGPTDEGLTNVDKMIKVGV